MLADERTRTETHHEWVLHSPAHESDVDAAWAEARNRHAQETTRDVSDVHFRCDGEETIVIGYTVGGDHECDWKQRAETARARLEAAEGKVARAQHCADVWAVNPSHPPMNAREALLAALADTEAGA